MDEIGPDNVVQVNFGKRPKPVSPLVEQKRSIFSDFLDAGIVGVSFDTTYSGAQVPPRFRGEKQLLLNFAYGYRVPDFGFDDEGIFGTMSFSEGFFFCFVPWDSVLAMHSEPLQKSAIWVFDEPESEEPEPAGPAPKPHLSLVKD